MSSITLEKVTGSVKISKDLSRRLSRFSGLAGFESIDSYASYVLNSMLDEIETRSESKISPRWAGGDDESHLSISGKELRQIKDELKSMIQVTC
jgi:hypothetical protein